VGRELTASFLVPGTFDICTNKTSCEAKENEKKKIKNINHLRKNKEMSPVQLTAVNIAPRKVIQRKPIV
jgi:hypothetical protein